MRVKRSRRIQNAGDLKSALLHWASRFQEVVLLDSNEQVSSYSNYDVILAVEAFTAIKGDTTGAFQRLEEYQESCRDWIFGYLTYDLKNDLEDLKSSKEDLIQVPSLYFFQPKKLFLLKGDHLELLYLPVVEDELETDLEDIFELQQRQVIYKGIEVQARMTKDRYLEKVQQLKQAISRGDIYEANFCQEFYAQEVEIDPLQVYNKLNSLSAAPFSVYLQLEEHFLLSASPERYLMKRGDLLISQPIKGTSGRSADPHADLELALALEKDPKERSENVMIVDLVRNDLSKVAAKGSVNLEELCKTYTFRQVHQLISTVSARLSPGISPVEAIRSTFPMGSMTGAPKISAMKIIEELEETKRGLYSGAVGYFTPACDFDFNVVIRSILYNKKLRNVSFSVGGAITSKSDPEKEYEECLIKAAALAKALK